MKNKFSGVGISVFFLLMAMPISALGDPVEYQAGTDCRLNKFSGGKWQVVDAGEVAGKTFVPQMMKVNPSYNAFNIGGAWYSAPKQCFGKPVAPAAETAVPAAIPSPSPEATPAASPAASPTPAAATTPAPTPAPTATPEPAKSESPAAAGENSQFLHQAKAGALEVTPAFSFRSSSVKFTGLVIPTAKSSGIAFSAMGEYGINENISAGLVLGYVSSTTEYPGTFGTVTDKGLSDPAIFGNGRFAMGPGHLRAGLTIWYSLSHQKLDASSNSNGASGGMTIEPMLGYEMPLGSGIFGAQFQYDYKGERTVDSAAGTLRTYKLTGGSTWDATLFYEMKFEPLTIGLAATYLSYSDSRRVASTGTLQYNDHGTSIGGNLYAAYVLNDQITILPSVIYSAVKFVPGVAATNVTSVSSLGAALAGRFKF